MTDDIIARKIALIGCGRMGGALLEQWRKGPDSFTIVDPAVKEAPGGVALASGPDDLAGQSFDVIVVAVKPQLIEEVMPQFNAFLAPTGYVLSIAAGTSIARLKEICGGKPVIRVMPNIPAAIGLGVSGICASTDVEPVLLDHARAMMRLAGKVIEVPDEDALDRLTAVAGSGPGYVFEMARSYVEAAKTLGFTHEESREMVIATLEGTVAMAKGSDASLADLRDSVTSKGGTTLAGLDALNGDGNFDERMRETLAKAYERAVELR